MIKFVYETPESHKEYTGVKYVEMQCETESTLTEMLDAYKQFLQSVGFQIDGVLDVVEDR